MHSWEVWYISSDLPDYPNYTDDDVIYDIIAAESIVQAVRKIAGFVLKAQIRNFNV